MRKIVTSVSTGKSRDLIKKSNRAEKKGEVVDWDDIFNQVKGLEAKKGEYIKAILEK